jgi:hypothetical protein
LVKFTLITQSGSADGDKKIGFLSFFHAVIFVNLFFWGYFYGKKNSHLVYVASGMILWKLRTGFGDWPGGKQINKI